MDYRKTLNLPKTDFPMKANLPKREPEIQKFWKDIDIYGRVLEATRQKPPFILHDGPPYANGDLHLGTALRGWRPIPIGDDVAFGRQPSANLSLPAPASDRQVW